MAYNVKFLKGTAAAYAALTKDANTFYYTTDDSQVYLGTIKLSNAGEIAAAVSRIAANESAISALQTAVNTLNGDDATEGSVAKQIKDAIAILENSLADVATSGAAVDVSVADTADKLQATNVEAALAELVDMIDEGGAGSVVTVTTKATPTEGYLKTYEISQGSSVVGTIDIPKDLVVTSGSIVTDPQGQPAGTYIQLTIANQAEPIYINVADLVDLYTAQQNATQVQLAIDSNNVISASIVAGSITGTEIATGTISKTKLDQDLQDAIDAANSAVQSVVEGSTNGTVAVDGVDVPVHGLGSAAYTASTAYDAAGTGAAEANRVLGTNADGASENTVYGAKAAAAAAQTAADAANTAIANLDVTDTAVTGKYVSAVSQSDGLITVTRADLPNYDDVYDPLGAADTAEANANTYTDNALTWGSF